MSENQYKCTRCPKSYVFKTGLTAHIKNKHPVQGSVNNMTGSKPATVTKASVPADPVRVVENGNHRKTVLRFSGNLDTQEINNLIEDEEEYFNAVEEFEHDIGINQSMIDWHKVDFEISFGNSREFNGRLASVVESKKCDECEINSKTIDSQRDLLTKQDKQLQDSHRIQKDMKVKLSHSVKNVNEIVKELAKSTKENTSLKIQLQVQLDAVLALKLKYESNSYDSSVEKTITKNKSDAEVEEGPLSSNKSKCNKCTFQTKNRVLMSEHNEKYHGGFKCLMCTAKFASKKHFIQHKKMHDAELNVSLLSSYPMNVYSFQCSPCQASFRTHEDMMDHLSEKHVRKEQRKRDEPVKFKLGPEISDHGNRPPMCTNGENCRFHSQDRCNFYHPLPPKSQQSRHQRQTPSNEWKQVPAQWQHRQQDQKVQQPHGHQAQGRRSWVASRDTSTTWCKHADNCMQGRFCALRKEGERDFPRGPAPKRR